MVRLVKGAYWDSEIKRAQVDGLDGFPVFTRKVHTDVSYLACARKLLAAPDAVFPQFATHNAQTLASILTMAGPNFYRGQYEFQCLHGMGEPLYEEVVGRDKLDRPCRVYAPVGSHETLLAYLVRRLLENGANTSFVNRIADASVRSTSWSPIRSRSPANPAAGAPHERSAAPRPLRHRAPQFARARPRQRAAARRSSPRARRRRAHDAARLPPGAAPDEDGRAGPQSGRSGDVVGVARTPAPTRSPPRSPPPRRPRRPGPPTPPRARRVLRRAADVLEERIDVLIGLIVREAGKTYANAVGEVREAVDFLRYYAAEAVRTTRSRLARAARRRRLHQPVEFSARDLHRPGRGGARRRQCGGRQARRADAADRRRGGAHPARGRRSARGARAPARARARSARRSSPTRACRAWCSPARRRSRA